METTVLICSVGGSAEPIRKSIDQQCPEFVVYIASSTSRKTIRPDIESALTWHGIKDSAVITLSDYQNLLTCVRDIRAGIERALQDMGLPEDTLLIADITGGTKVMSAALTLVMMEYRSRFAYMGGESRTKSGLGVVESGHEILMQQDNPWDVLALREVRSLTRAFNTGQFSTALTTAKELADHIPKQKNFYAALADVVESYALWDGFAHKKAAAKLRQGLNRLTPYTSSNERLFRQLASLWHSLELLESIQQDAQKLLYEETTKGQTDYGSAYLRDLLANAARCAQRGHFDDAVARLYSAIEKSAKVALLAHHGVNNSAVDLSRVPESLRESLINSQGEDGVIRIGLQRSFLLLEALGDPLGASYRTHAVILEKQLTVRNLSLLAHGYLPVSSDAYDKLFATALNFLEVHSEDLPIFPRLEWKSLLL